MTSSLALPTLLEARSHLNEISEESHPGFRRAATYMGPPPSRLPVVLQRYSNSPGVQEARNAAKETLRRRQSGEVSPGDTAERQAIADTYGSAADEIISVTEGRGTIRAHPGEGDDDDARKRKKKRFAAQFSRQLPIVVAKELEIRLEKVEQERDQLVEAIRRLRESMRKEISSASRQQHDPITSQYQQATPGELYNNSEMQSREEVTSLLNFLPKTEAYHPPPMEQHIFPHQPIFRPAQSDQALFGVPGGSFYPSQQTMPLRTQLREQAVQAHVQMSASEAVGNHPLFRHPAVNQAEEPRTTSEAIAQTMDEIQTAFTRQERDYNTRP